MIADRIKPTQPVCYPCHCVRDMADVDFEHIRPLFSALPALDKAASEELRARFSDKKAAEELAWLAEIRGEADIVLDRPSITLFAGLHQRSRGDLKCHRALIESRIDSLTSASDPLYDLCGKIDVDLRLHEMALDEPAGAVPDGPALSENACARAIAYGLTAVEDGPDVLGIAALAPGIEPVLEAVAAKTLDPDLSRAPAADAVLEILADVGGHETCALFGALLGARIARIPVLLDGASALAAAFLASAVPGGADHCRPVAPASGDLEALFVERARLAPPVLDKPSDGDGSGAARAILSLRTRLKAGGAVSR